MTARACAILVFAEQQHSTAIFTCPAQAYASIIQYSMTALTATAYVQQETSQQTTTTAIILTNTTTQEEVFT